MHLTRGPFFGSAPSWVPKMNGRPAGLVFDARNNRAWTFGARKTTLAAFLATAIVAGSIAADIISRAN